MRQNVALQGLQSPLWVISRGDSEAQLGSNAWNQCVGGQGNSWVVQPNQRQGGLGPDSRENGTTADGRSGEQKPRIGP